MINGRVVVELGLCRKKHIWLNDVCIWQMFVKGLNGEGFCFEYALSFSDSGIEWRRSLPSDTFTIGAAIIIF